MTNLTIGLPDELARDLEGIAAAQHKTVQQLAVERLSSLVLGEKEPSPGSPVAVLRAMRETPHLSAADMDELDASVASGRLAIQPGDPFAA